MSSLPIDEDSIDIKNGRIIGNNEQGVTQRFSETDIADSSDSKEANWERIIEAIYDEITVNETEEMSVQVSEVYDPLTESIEEIESDSQAALVLQWLSNEGRISVRNNEIVICPTDSDAIEENPAYLYNLAKFMEELSKECSNAVEQYNKKLTSIQETVDDLRDKTRDIEEKKKESKQKIRNICDGEVPRPKGTKDSDIKGVDVGIVPPDSVKEKLNKNELDIYKREWGEIVQAEKENPYTASVTAGEALLEKYQGQMDSLERRGEELKYAASDTRAAAVSSDPNLGSTDDLLKKADKLKGFLDKAEDQVLNEPEVNVDDILDENATTDQLSDDPVQQPIEPDIDASDSNMNLSNSPNN